jgi:hypothetical protein
LTFSENQISVLPSRIHFEYAKTNYSYLSPEFETMGIGIFGLFFLIVAGLIIIAFFGMLFSLSAKLSEGRRLGFETKTTNQGPIRVEIEPEGFTLSWDKDVPVGSYIDYEFTVSGKTIPGNVRVSTAPGSAPIATGKRPTRVRTRLNQSGNSSFPLLVGASGISGPDSADAVATSSDDGWSVSESVPTVSSSFGDTSSSFSGGTDSSSGGWSGSSSFSSDSSSYSGGGDFSSGSSDSGGGGGGGGGGD